MSNTVPVDSWLLSCGASSFTSTSNFYFPPKFVRTTHFGGNQIRASATSNGSTEESAICKSLLCGRRALLSMTTLSLVLPCDRSVGSIAADESFLLREEIRKVLSKGKAAGVLRLVFHDAGTFEIDEKTGGMNGSIVFELERPENKGLKKSLKLTSQSVHCSLDSGESKESNRCCATRVPDPEGKLPEESLDATSLKQCFERKGFSTQELVALSGAHTLGSKGFGNPTVFDNAYFKILMEKPWLSPAGMTSMVGLPSDRALDEDDECVRWISMYAEDQGLFFEDFKNAYAKLVDTGATWKKSL